MRGQDEHTRQSGVVILALLVLVVLGIIAAAFLFVKQAYDKKPVSTTAAEVVEASGSAISRAAQNTQRKNDATRLLAIAQEYVSTNSGNVPTDSSQLELTGMGHYTSALLAEGAQGAVTTDELRLVTGATCSSDGTTVEGATSRSLAVQFVIQNSDGTFEPQCLDG